MFPEIAARNDIDAKLQEAEWAVQDRKLPNLAAGRGIAVREFPMMKGHGTVDCLLYVDRKAVATGGSTALEQISALG